MSTSLVDGKSVSHLGIIAFEKFTTPTALAKELLFSFEICDRLIVPSPIYGDRGGGGSGSIGAANTVVGKRGPDIAEIEMIVIEVTLREYVYPRNRR